MIEHRLPPICLNIDGHSGNENAQQGIRANAAICRDRGLSSTLAEEKHMPSKPSWQEQVDARQKLLEPLIQRAIDRTRDAVVARTPKITSSFFYGATGIHPKHLAIWYVFATETQKNEARLNGLLEILDRKSRDALREEGYEPSVVEGIGVSFASDEEINRAGGWRAFFA